MKVTIVGPAYPLRGGIAHHVYGLQQALISHGNKVHVISFRRLYPKLLFPGTTPLDPSRLKLDPGADPILDSVNPFTWRKALKKVKTFQPDLILLQWWNPFFAFLVTWLGRRFTKTGLRCALECHNIFPHEHTPFDRALIRFAFSRFQYFITHSLRDREDLLTLFPGKTVKVTPLLINIKAPRRGSHPTGPKTILFFGVVRKYKGLEVLLRAMPKVLSKVECELIIAGEFYEPIRRYMNLINELGIGGHVHIENRYVPNEEVGELFRRADVLALPYLSTSQSGIAQLALVNALPIIASETGGLPEIIIENVNGLLVPPGDPDALADAIVSFFSKNLGVLFTKDLLSSFPNEGTAGIGQVIEEMVGNNPVQTS
ncbi:MAG: glycosyltransferase family 4 protein [Terriglobia bacterium]